MYEDGISIIEIINSILRRKLLVIFIVLLSLIISLIFLHFSQYLYKSTVTVLVDPIKKSSTIGTVLSSDFFNSSDDISTEVQLLTNKTNLQSAIYKLDLDNYYNSEGIAYTNLNIYSGLKDKVSVSLLNDTNIVEISVTDSNSQFAADFANAIAESFNELLSTFSKDSKNAQIEFLKKQIPEAESKLEDASDKLFDYKAKNKIDFISNNINTIANNISYLKMRKKPLELQHKKNLSSIKEYYSSYGDNLLSLEVIKNDLIIKSYLKKYESSYDEILLFDLSSNVNSWNTTNLSVVNSNINIGVNDRISELNGLINESKAAIINRLDELMINNSLKERDIKNSLLKINRFIYMVMEFLTCEIDIVNIDNIIKSFEIEFNKLPILEKELSKLQSDVDSLESIRKELNLLLEQISLTAAADENNVKLVSSAVVSSSPVSPNRLLILAVSFLLGCAISVLLCLLLQMMDDIIHTIDDLKLVLNKRVILLGWTPFIVRNKKGKKQQKNDLLLMNDYPNSYIAERYKLVSSNILYGANKNKKVFAITSATINEGKSFFICNFALSLAKNSFKVLVIDGDIKCPTIEKHFGLKQNETGYINLIQENKDIDEAIVNPIKNLNKLSIISPGKSEVVQSVFYKNTNFGKILSKAREKYDIILIDNPPFEFASDLLKYVDFIDSILLCTRLGISSKNNLNILLDNLESCEDKIGGVIATACPLESLKKYVNNYNSYNKYYNYVDDIRIKKNEFYRFIRKEKEAKKIFKKNLKDRNNK